MSAQPTPRFTLPDPDRDPMTPLPAELWARILRCAQEGQTAEEQLKTRLSFEKVCKAWFMCEFRWKVVALPNFTALELFLDSLVVVGQSAGGGVVTRQGGAGVVALVEKLGRQVKALHLRTSWQQGQGKTVKLIKLLSLVSNVAWVSLVIDDEGLGRGRALLSDVISAALRRLSKLKHLELTGPRQGIDEADERSTSCVLGQLESWNELESLKLADCTSIASIEGTRKLTSSLAFKSLELCRCGPQLESFDALLAALPLSTRELTIDDECAFVYEQPVKALSEAALEVTRQLRVVKLTAGHEPSDVGHGDGERGLMNEFIANLDNVQELVIHPSVTDNLGALAQLKKLTHLKVHTGLNALRERPDVAELLQLVSESTSLKRLVYLVVLGKDWTREQGKNLLLTAKERNIDFVWIDALEEELPTFSSRKYGVE